MRSILIFSLLFTALSGHALEPATAPAAIAANTAHVKGDRVNLRGRPDANGEVVGQAAAGETLTLIEVGDTWVSVVPPATIKCWVHKDFVQDGKVAVKELTVRAGASINYPRIGSLFRGEPITPRETFGEWLCVAPPTNAIVWVHRDLLDLAPRIAPTAPTAAVITPTIGESAPALPISTNRMSLRISPTEPEREPTATGTPIHHQAVVLPPRVTTFTSTDTNATAAAPADLNLIPLPGQGIVNRHEGIVQTSAYDTAPARHRLVLKKGDTLETICYLRGNKAQLTTLENQTYMMQGREYWVQGIKEPVLLIERIERRDTPANP